MSQTIVGSELTTGLFLSRLQEKVSDYNAKLLLHSALQETGFSYTNQDQLPTEDAKILCLKLINKGGPSFHVGQSIYKEFLQ